MPPHWRGFVRGSMMDLRSHYENLLKQLIDDSEKVAFRVCFPSKFVDVSSDFALAVARLHGTSFTDECRKICKTFENHSDFLDLKFRESDGILTWNIPPKIWFSQLEELYENLQSAPEIPFVDINLSQEEIFQLQYVYARIHSVYQHFFHRFPKEKIPTSANFSLESMKILLNLIKTIVGYSRWMTDIIENENSEDLRKYPVRLIEVFNELWDWRKDGAEMIFVFPNDLVRTQAEIFILECLKRVLQQIFAVLRVNPVEELG